MYKSKQEKLQLLDDAIALHDGNAIIAVSLIREVGMGGVGRQGWGEYQIYEYEYKYEYL